MNVLQVKEYDDIFKQNLTRKKTLAVDKAGNIFFLENGLLHRDDGPAVYIRKVFGKSITNMMSKYFREGEFYYFFNKKEYEIILKGSEIWFHRGVPHREGAPAITSKNGCVWFNNGMILGRGKKPSVCYKNLKLWFNNEGQLHRDKKPAYISEECLRWFQDGKEHRDDDKPARIYKDGGKFWFKNGKIHRDNKPAYMIGDEKNWYQNGELHRDDGPAIEDNEGKQWWVNGLLHRLDGPAVVWSDGSEEWWVNDEIHRLDGPAKIFINDFGITNCYYINNIEHDKETWEKITSLINKHENKIVNKYARVWYEKCDYPGTKIWENNIKKGWESIEKLIKE